MADNITINVPVKRHLKNYLLRKLRLCSSSVLISTDDPINFGLYIISILSKKYNYLTCDNPVSMKAFMENITDHIYLEIPPKYEHKHGLFLTPDKIFFINKFIDTSMRTELCNNINWMILHNPDYVIQYAIDDFTSIYNISEDDIKLESIVKYFHRHKSTFSYIN